MKVSPLHFIFEEQRNLDNKGTFTVYPLLIVYQTIPFEHLTYVLYLVSNLRILYKSSCFLTGAYTCCNAYIQTSNWFSTAWDSNPNLPNGVLTIKRAVVTMLMSLTYSLVKPNIRLTIDFLNNNLRLSKFVTYV